MSSLDWIVLVASLVFIVLYGVWKGRGSQNIEGYLLANKTLPWHSVGLSIMATQASAITFLSAPGQAYADGMRFVQFYFGLPVAMVVLSITAVPIYRRLQVYTAYEYLEGRFDLKTRALAAALFLVQRGLATGLTIYAPSLILSSILGWNIYLTNAVIGALVIVYTVAGGSKGVSYTQLGQAAIILTGMFAAFGMMVHLLPADISLLDAVRVAGKTGKLNAIDFSFDWNNRYNLWSGLIGGFFLAMSYFGTDQSQVGRYLAGASVAQSRLGLLMNGIVKIPMQLSILFIGSVLFVFYQFAVPPLFFNRVETEKMYESPYAATYQDLEAQHRQAFRQKERDVRGLVGALRTDDAAGIREAGRRVAQSQEKAGQIRQRALDLMKQNDDDANTNDSNYVFLSFVTRYLPAGLVGLLIAVVFAASMGSTASAINSLASTTVVDIYKRSIRPAASERHYVVASKVFTVGWGVYCVVVAQYANRLGNLLETVNELGSLFYGAILGIFVVAFYFKSIRGSSTFYAALVTEAVVLGCYFTTGIAFLWYNVIGCLLVVVLAWAFSVRRLAL
ncbi:MAG: sodium:solute symporter [Ferruginibacter sp.]|nr:sodium:solute symporter [Cytophagales bacterium]